MGRISNRYIIVLIAVLLSVNATAQEEGKPLSIDPAGLDQKGRYSPVLQSPTREEVLAYRRKKGGGNAMSRRLSGGLSARRCYLY